MKKFIFVIMLLLIFTTDTNAASKFYFDQIIPKMYIEKNDSVNISNEEMIMIRRDDGRFVYSLNPYKDLNTSDYYKQYSYNNKKFNLTDEQLNRINLLAYYGYNYHNHKDLKWYGITQYLIWKELNYKDVYIVDLSYSNRINYFDSEIKELENLVDLHYILPSFASENFDYNTNNTYEIIDKNNIISNYEVLKTELDVKISNNKLTINTKEEGTYEIVFIRKSSVNIKRILYELDGFKSLFLPGKIDEIKFKITIEVKSGNVTINGFDSENHTSLSGLVYEIYDNNGLITTITSNENGTAYLDNLSIGEYYIKEKETIIGYQLDTKIYNFNITEENKNIVINTYKDKIKGNLIINKYYGKRDNYKLEDGAVFELYDINNNKIGEYKTKNGIIDIELQYGDYYLLQIEGIDGYKFVDKLNISIKENKDYKINLYNERELIVVEVPDTLKNNYNKSISIFFILLGLIIIIVSKVRYKHNKRTTDCQ